LADTIRSALKCDFQKLAKNFIWRPALHEAPAMLLLRKLSHRLGGDPVVAVRGHALTSAFDPKRDIEVRQRVSALGEW